MRVRITHNTPEIVAAFRRAPQIMRREMDPFVSRGAIELAREMRERAPKASSELTQAILPRRLQLADWLVEARKHYARYVEEGTGPGRWPPTESILDWMRQRGIQDEDGDQDSLAYLIQRAIFRRGTPAQPFAAPSLRALTGRIRNFIERGAERGLSAVARAG